MASFKEQFDSDITCSDIEAIHQALRVCCFYPHQNVAFIVPKFSFAAQISNNIWAAHATVPVWMAFAKLIRKTRMITEFDNGSRIQFIYTSNHLKGRALSYVFIHRLVEMNEDMVGALLPSIYHNKTRSIEYFK
jgi:hypothetical protein